MERNGSLVNKIFDRIPDKPVNTRGLKLGQIDCKMMMSDKKTICSREVSDLYDKINRQYRYAINMKDEHADNLHYIACKIREEFGRLGYSDETLADMLTEYLYGRKKRYKQILWFCYGEYLVQNIEKNLKERREYKSTKYVRCADCGEWFELPLSSKAERCESCKIIYKRKQTKQRVQTHRKQKCNAM